MTPLAWLLVLSSPGPWEVRIDRLKCFWNRGNLEVNARLLAPLLFALIIMVAAFLTPYLSGAGR